MSANDKDREPRPDGTRDDMHDEFDLHDADEAEMDALDRLILGAAADYHRPPTAPPREAMWEAILAARTTAGAPAAPAAPAAAPELRVVRTTAAPSGAPDRASDVEVRRWAHRRWIGLAAAASLLLATGVGLGRWWGQSRAEQGARERGVSGATGAEVAVAPRAGDSAAGRPAAGASAGAPGSAPGAASDVTPDRGVTRDVDLRDRRRAGAGDVGGVPRSFGPQLATLPASGAAGADGDDAGGNAAYDVATFEHYTAAEALLVSYRRARTGGELSDSLTAALDVRLSAWAGQLLQDTRLLLDSPAGTDPRRRQLLEDLELVLAQITRLGAARATGPVAGERAAIDGNLQRGQVLSRLRNAIPSGT